MENKRHYLVYQITNLINGKIYIGIHSTKNINDGYMGSGTYLKNAIIKHGIENFKKEILFDFDNPEDMIEKERELVDRKFIARKDVYNITLGGIGWCSVDTITVKDSNNNYFRVHKTDDRYLSGELKAFIYGKIVVKDTFGNIHIVDQYDDKFTTGEYVGCCKGTSTVKDLDGNCLRIPYDLFIENRNSFQGMFAGRHHSEKSKKIMSDKAKFNQKGEKNSQFGTCWIHNETENKKIKKELINSFLSEGWIKGRKMKF